MMWNAENGKLNLHDGEMDYIRFGTGNRTMVMLPGASDGLKTVKGMALPFALLYRSLTRDFTVYAFSRRNNLAPHRTTRQMAEDVSEAMMKLGIPRADIVGVSMGGMIAQWLAADHPEQVNHLVLAVTAARVNPVSQAVLEHWMELARKGDYPAIMLDTARKSYSAKRVKSAELTSRLMGNIGKPKSFDRFLIQMEACRNHDAYDVLSSISAPTLVIGGTDDQIVTAEGSRELAEQIPGSQLVLYEGLGHGLYEEAPDFWERTARFCTGG